ncbi:MAG: DNA polymerase III subunit alpha [Candidatus Taylorbacteria bacterium]|nr:DNA polymerase III subunit alpha [Candidatus Taylorbacteria bacterium]
MSSKFIHLHVHSHYSLLNALPKIDDLVKIAKKYEMPALALTDNANLYGAIEFYKACKKAEIKPIIGIDAYVAARTRNDRQAGVDNRRSRLILLVKNLDGYKNLIKLVTLANLEGFYYKPRIDKELIEKYSEGLICISPSFSGAVSQALKNNDPAKAKELLTWYKKTYGKENVFLEITHHPEIEGHEVLMEKIISLSKNSDTPLVAGHDVYYINPDDKKARETLMLVQSGSESGKMQEDDGDFSFINEKQAEEYFKKTPEAIENTLKIADMCNFTLELGKWVFPDYKVESGLSYDAELERLVTLGIEKRKIEKTKVVEDRITYELKVIRDKGYAPYFLVVSDLLRYAHEHGILTTIRGSVAGSLVTYLAGITNVNPIEYKLPFERFLNPERPSAPDIDMDFADNRRDEMIEYAKQKYGHKNVAQIGTFGTMMARGSVRDVARAMGHAYSVGDRISKLIPMGAQGFPMTLDRALNEVAELKEMYGKEAETKEIIDMAKKIEGCARHMGVHAAGVVISPRPLTDFVALQFDTKGDNKIITQFDMHAVEDAGLLKFDFLGIKNLSILADAVDRVKKIDSIIVDIENVPVNDQKTFDMLAKGETIGLFQLNGTGMTRFLKELKPSTIHDINAMVALYRPGPMESIPQYIERKHDSSLIKYLDPRMKDILSESYGVITYQDDVMLIAIHLGGYSWLEADKLRKAMGKKIPKEMEEQKGKLKEGLKKNGMNDKKIEALWKLIEPFAAYGFNKAHAASYGRVAYQTAYMKANFPEIYMSAVLTADSGDVEKIGEIIAECKRMGIPVLPPDINESFSQFTVIKDVRSKIRFGLVTIKNFGQGISTSIIEERKKNGKFTSLANFLERVKDRNLNKKSLEALIKTGALDEFGERGIILGNTEGLLAYNKEFSKSGENHTSLFGGMESASHVEHLKLVDTPPATIQEKLIWEKELLGLYISGHPLDKYKDMLTKRDFSIKKAKEELKEGMSVVIGGIIEEAKPIITKKGDNMMFLKISDYTGSIEAVVFPRTYIEFKNILTLENCIAFKGKFSERNGTQSIIIEKIKQL